MLLFLAQSAFAYELLGFDWAWQENPLEYPVVLDADTFPPDFADVADLEENLQAACDAWTDAGSNLTVDYAGIQSGPQTEAIRVYYVEQSPGALLGAALTGSIGADLVSCEIQVYRSNGQLSPIPWSFSPNESDLPFEQFDFQTVMTHELGHCLGLNHTDDNLAVMFPSSINGIAVRSPNDDDQAGMVAMYGKSSGGCDTTGSAAWLAWLALPALLFRRR